jgi:hypothetical protein
MSSIDREARSAAHDPFAGSFVCPSCGAHVAYEGGFPEDCIKCGASTAEELTPAFSDPWPEVGT